MEYARKNPGVAIWVIAPDDLQGVKRQFANASSNIHVIQNDNDKDMGEKLFRSYQTKGTPTQILVDSAGIIKWRGEGFDKEHANPFLPGQLPLE